MKSYCLSIFLRCADTDPNLIHERDVERAAKEAKAKYLELHPEAADVELKTDVSDMVDNCEYLNVHL